MLGTWGCRVVDGVSDPDDRGVDCGVEVPDCPGWICVSFGVVVCVVCVLCCVLCVRVCFVCVVCVCVLCLCLCV